MKSADTDKAWEYYGRHDPYYGVLTTPEFQRRQLTSASKNEFFATGRRYVEWMWSVIVQHLEPQFRPTRALDFGCGVGRLLIPLADRCDSVVGVDVSASMLKVAQANCSERGLKNVSFVRGDDSLSRVTGEFDFIHSFIVFQHIPTERGYAILGRQLSLLKPDGLGALHFTYAYAGDVPPNRRLVIGIRERVPAVHALRNMINRSAQAPAMQMNRYDLNVVLRHFQEAGCHDMHVRFSETSVSGHGFYGATFFFRKRPLNVRAFA
jgi:SAM-dependent methyltransferase